MLRHSKYVIFVLVISTLHATCAPKSKPLFSEGVESCKKNNNGVVTSECWENYLISESKTNPDLMNRCEAKISLAEVYAASRRNPEAERIYRTLLVETNLPQCASRIQASYKAFNEVRVGLKAPEFVARDVQGNSINLAALRGRTVVLLFWSSGCGACKYAYADLNTIKENRADKITIIGISGDESRVDFDRTVAEYSMPWQNILDGDDFLGPISKLYAIDRYPAISVINEEGIISGHSYQGLLPKKTQP